MIPFLELQSQFRAIEPEVRAAIDGVLDSSWFVLGKELAAFEEAFAGYIGADYAEGVGSGTDAIQMALMALGVGPGDEVITAANTCVPTVAGICATGATPVLVDAAPRTLTLDPAHLKRAITERTKAIVAVHLYGHPCDMDEIRVIADGKGVAVVEDCAQAHGAEYKGRRCGTLGDAAAFSFYPSKNLGAYGDGGAVVTDNPDLAWAVRHLRNYGKEPPYTHRHVGINSRLDELQAAVLRAKLPHLDAWNEARRTRAKLYARFLSGTPITLPCEAPWARHCYHLYVIRTEERDALQRHLYDNGIETQIHYLSPIHLLDAFKELGTGPGSFPVAERASAEVLSLPLYPELSEDKVEFIAETVRAFTGP